jgi:phage baseplate assembly protein W
MSDFLGRGWRFPILPDAGGGLRYLDGDGNVGQSLWLLLSTGWGERVMRPRFGTNARALVFAPASTANLHALEESIEEAIAVHEPRARLLSVEATPDPLEPERVDIEVVYTVRRSNTRSSFVFPYYLARPGGMP